MGRIKSDFFVLFWIPLMMFSADCFGFEDVFIPDGKLEVLNERQESFQPKVCLDQQSCRLKDFSMISQDYRIWILDRFHYGTRIAFIYRTQEPESLQNFVITQKIRGCHYTSQAYKTSDGKDALKKELPFYRYFFNEIVPMKHPRWVVDSEDLDPAYSSSDNEQLSRHHAYMWRVSSEYFLNDRFEYYGNRMPQKPELYIVNRPGQAFYETNTKTAKNLSMEFQTCLYSNQQVPLRSSPENSDFGTPIHCFSWQSKWAYNHKLQEFESKAALDPICL